MEGERIGHRRRMAARLRNWFFTGIIVAAPLAITVWLVSSIVAWIDGIVKPWFPPRWDPEAALGVPLPGIGVVVALVGLTVLGFFTASFVGRFVVRLYEALLRRMPLIRNVYAALKQIFETALSERQRTFRHAGLIEYPRRGLWSIVFIATEAKGEINHRISTSEDDAISVFLPSTPNPTTGFLIFVPRKDVLVLDMSVEEAAKLVISAGLITPEWREPPAIADPATARIAERQIEVPVLGKLSDVDLVETDEPAR